MALEGGTESGRSVSRLLQWSRSALAKGSAGALVAAKKKQEQFERHYRGRRRSWLLMECREQEGEETKSSQKMGDLAVLY